MKTILELSPKGNTLWEIPDEAYPVIDHLLHTQRRVRHPFSRSRVISVGEAVAMLPEELRGGITAKAHQREEPKPPKEPQIEFIEFEPVSEEFSALMEKMKALREWSPAAR